MAKFVLTAQIQLRSPSSGDVRRTVTDIERALKDVKVDVSVAGTKTARSDLARVEKSVDSVTKSADRMGRAFAISIKRFAAFSVATRMVSMFTRGLGGAIQEAVDFERQLIKVSQVTGKTMRELKDLSREITHLATSLGVSSKALLNVSRILSQAGMSARETKVALEALAKSTLAATFEDILQTAEGAVAIFNQFGKGAKALEGQLGAINAVAGQFAVEAGDLIAVIRRTGGVFKAAGGDLNQLIALFTSVRATTRESAESIATGLRTIFTRIQRPSTIKFLKALGVELTTVEGKFVGPFEAIKKLADALGGLEPGDLRFIKIAEQLGGFRQIGKVIPLLQQNKVAWEALKVAMEGANSLTKDAQTAQGALAVRITKVKEEWLALIRSFTESKTFMIMANTALSLASSLIKVAEALKPIIPLITAIAAVKLFTGARGFFGGLKSTLASPGAIPKMASGGIVPGSGSGDTTPAMLTPGEFVIKKSSVKSIGSDRLHAMNQGRKKYAKGGRIILKDNEIGAFISKSTDDMGTDVERGFDRKAEGKGLKALRNAAVINKLRPPKKGAGDQGDQDDQLLRTYSDMNTGGDAQEAAFPGIAADTKDNKSSRWSAAGKSGIAPAVQERWNKASKAEKDKIRKSHMGLSGVGGTLQVGIKGKMTGFKAGVDGIDKPSLEGLIQASAIGGLKKAVGDTAKAVSGPDGPLSNMGKIKHKPGVVKAALSSLVDPNVPGGAVQTIEGYVWEGLIASLTGAKLTGGGASFDFKGDKGGTFSDEVKKNLGTMFGNKTGIGQLVKADAKRSASDDAWTSIANKVISDVDKDDWSGVNFGATKDTFKAAAGGLVQRLAKGGVAKENKAKKKFIEKSKLMRVKKTGPEKDGWTQFDFYGRSGAPDKKAQGQWLISIDGHVISAGEAGAGKGNFHIDNTSPLAHTSLRGKGYGSAAYKMLYDWTRQNQLGLFSDYSVSASAGLTWSGLRQHYGIPVQMMDPSMADEAHTLLSSQKSGKGTMGLGTKGSGKLVSEQPVFGVPWEDTPKLAAGGGINGTDTVPALLTPGEFIVNKKAAQSIGYGALHRMNSRGVEGFASGGVIGGPRKFQGGGMGGAGMAIVMATAAPMIAEFGVSMLGAGEETKQFSQDLSSSITQAMTMFAVLSTGLDSYNSRVKEAAEAKKAGAATEADATAEVGAAAGELKARLESIVAAGGKGSASGRLLASDPELKSLMTQLVTTTASGTTEEKAAVEAVVSAVEAVTSEVKATAGEDEAAGAGADKKSAESTTTKVKLKTADDISAAKVQVDEQMNVDKKAKGEEIGQLKDQQENLRSGAIAKEEAIETDQKAALDESAIGVVQASQQENAAHVALADAEANTNAQEGNVIMAEAEAADLKAKAAVEPKVTEAQVQAAEEATNAANTERHSAEGKAADVSKEGVQLQDKKAADQKNLAVKQQAATAALKKSPAEMAVDPELNDRVAKAKAKAEEKIPDKQSAKAIGGKERETLMKEQKKKDAAVIRKKQQLAKAEEVAVSDPESKKGKKQAAKVEKKKAELKKAEKEASGARGERQTLDDKNLKTQDKEREVVIARKREGRKELQGATVMKEQEQKRVWGENVKRADAEAGAAAGELSMTTGKIADNKTAQGAADEGVKAAKQKEGEMQGKEIATKKERKAGLEQQEAAKTAAGTAEAKAAAEQAKLNELKGKQAQLDQEATAATEGTVAAGKKHKKNQDDLADTQRNLKALSEEDQKIQDKINKKKKERLKIGEKAAKQQAQLNALEAKRAKKVKRAAVDKATGVTAVQDRATSMKGKLGGVKGDMMEAGFREVGKEVKGKGPLTDAKRIEAAKKGQKYLSAYNREIQNGVSPLKAKDRALRAAGIGLKKYTGATGKAQLAVKRMGDGVRASVRAIKKLPGAIRKANAALGRAGAKAGKMVGGVAALGVAAIGFAKGQIDKAMSKALEVGDTQTARSLVDKQVQLGGMEKMAQGAMGGAAMGAFMGPMGMLAGAGIGAFFAKMTDDEGARRKQAEKKISAIELQQAKESTAAGIKTLSKEGLSQGTANDISSAMLKASSAINRKVGDKFVFSEKERKKGNAELVKMEIEVAKQYGSQAKTMEELDAAMVDLRSNTIGNGEAEYKAAKAAFAVAEGMRALAIANADVLKITSTFNAANLAVSNFVNGLQTGTSGMVGVIATLKEAQNNIAMGSKGIQAVERARKEVFEKSGIKKESAVGQSISRSFDHMRAAAEFTSKLPQKIAAVKLEHGDDPEVVKDKIRAELMMGIDPSSEMGKVIEASIGKLTDAQLKAVAQGKMDMSQIVDTMSKDIAKLGEGALKAAEAILKHENTIATLTKKRIQSELKLIEAQKAAINLSMEASSIIAKHGGPAVTPEMRRNAIISKANLTSGRLGLGQLGTGSGQELQGRTDQILKKFAGLEIKGRTSGAFEGSKGLDADKRGELETELKSLVNTTRELIKADEEALGILRQKNQLEKDSLESLVTGDLNKFLEGQAAIGATAAIATGDQRLMGMFGGDALGGAFQNIKRMQEAGVQEVHGVSMDQMMLGGAGAALGARGITDPGMAAMMAGQTGEEQRLRDSIKGKAGALGAMGGAMGDMAAMQVKSAQMVIDQAQVIFKGTIEAGVVNIGASAAGSASAAGRAGGVAGGSRSQYGTDMRNQQPQQNRGEFKEPAQGEWSNWLDNRREAWLGTRGSRRAGFSQRGNQMTDSYGNTRQSGGGSTGTFMMSGGAVYAAGGVFVPRGTDVVPAMLTPGEFVINRASVARGNNLQVLKAINEGRGAPQAMARGGMVQYLQGGGEAGAGMQFAITNVGEITSAFSKFNSDLANNLKQLAGVKLNIKLDTTNVNVNLNGTSFMQEMSDKIKSELFAEIGEQIGSISFDPNGKASVGDGVL